MTGLVADPGHSDKLPVGFAKTEGPNIPVPQAGFTCSFCHTTQFSYKGHAIKIDGGPSLQYNSRFLSALIQRLGMLLPPDQPAFFKSLKRTDSARSPSRPLPLVSSPVVEKS